MSESHKDVLLKALEAEVGGSSVDPGTTRGRSRRRCRASIRTSGAARSSTTREACMELTRSIDIDAPPGIVWEVWSDIARWHEWTASITSIDPLGPGPLAVGLRARVRQPKFPPAVHVGVFEPGRSRHRYPPHRVACRRQPGHDDDCLCRACRTRRRLDLTLADRALPAARGRRPQGAQRGASPGQTVIRPSSLAATRCRP